MWPYLTKFNQNHARNLCLKVTLASWLHWSPVFTNCCVVGLLTVRMDSCHFTDNSYSVTSCHPKSVWRHDMVRGQNYAALYLCRSIFKALSHWTVSQISTKMCCLLLLYSLKALTGFCLFYSLTPGRQTRCSLGIFLLQVPSKMKKVLIKAPNNYLHFQVLLHLNVFLYLKA